MRPSPAALPIPPDRAGQIAGDILSRLAAIGIQPMRLENDSRRVDEDAVFVAYPGAQSDGRSFIGDALHRRAMAVLWEREGYAWNPAWMAPNLGVEQLREISGYLAHRVAGRPSEKLRLVGLTGTNGKTTCSQWIAHALSEAGSPCAVVGTLGNGFPGALAGSPNTTPDAIALHTLLAGFVAAGARACAAEVSSIGLDQGRCNGACFEVAVFTNFTRDHLDYHGTMAAYAEAKRRLFTWPGLRAMVINLDDPFGRELLSLRSDARRIGYTLAAGDPEVARVAARCDTVLAVSGITYGATGVRFAIDEGGVSRGFSAPAIGLFNVANLAAVAGTLRALGTEFEDLPHLLARLSPPAGRMQRYGGEAVPLVVVDYAHSPDALGSTLAALRPVAEARGGKLVCVFGCGGDRDRGKRPLMGEVAARLADRVVVTSDNPRSEDPAAIIAEIRVGAPAATADVDRASAIASAIAGCAPADVVLVAGKGHETYQEIAGVRHPYADADVVRRVLAELAAARGARTGS